jgi:hypothetical protein
MTAQGARSNRPGQHLDCLCGAAIQRAIGRVEGSHGSVLGRLSRGAEVLWHRCRCGGCGQYENRRSCENGRGPRSRRRQMTAGQRELYGQSFDTFATTLNGMQSRGLDSVSAATRVIELAEQVPAPSRAPVGADADEMLRAAREKSDADPNKMTYAILGSGAIGTARPALRRQRDRSLPCQHQRP